MSLDTPITAPLADLHDAVERWGGVEWIAAREEADAIVVLFRRTGAEGADAPLEGVRVVADVRGGSRSSLVDDAVFEIVRADGPAVKLRVHWADGLVADPTAVRWRGGAIAQSARLALRRFGSSGQGCEGAPL